MSINFSYRRLSQSELDELLDGSQEVYEKWFGPMELMDDDAFADYKRGLQGRAAYLDISNSYQAIHFLLTNEFCFQGESRTPAPLKNVVMGGTPTDIETTYGVAFYLTPQEASEVAQALRPLSLEVVTRNYNASRFRDARVYPAYERWEDDSLKDYGIDSDYENLRQFFFAAAQDGQAVILASD